MSEENVELVRRCLDGWNRGDFDAWRVSSHPDIEFFSSITLGAEGDAAGFRGAEEMRRYWDEWHSLWDLTHAVTEFRDLGDTVLATGSMKVRGKGSGVEIGSPVAYVFVFDEGLLRTVHAYLDVAEALEAVGLGE